jgi:hypothetical protein
MRTSSIPYMDFVEPMILKILKLSEIPMTTLCINYRVNENFGRRVSMGVIRSNLRFLVNHKKISEKMDKKNGITSYKFIL